MVYRMLMNCFNWWNSSSYGRMQFKTNKIRCVSNSFIWKSCQAYLRETQARYLRLIFDLLEAGASTVVYEAASSLTSLTNNPVAAEGCRKQVH